MSLHINIQQRKSGFALAIDTVLPLHGITAITGPSGSGKTSLLRCIAGLEPQVTGEIRFNSTTWQNAARFVPPHQRSIAYVFQEASLFNHLSVNENLHYGLKRSRDPQPEQLAQAIELFGLAPLLNRRPETLSGGEKQRVAIARALAVNPKLLLMDEPLASLDAARKQEILPYLEQLRAHWSLPILYVSHSADEIARLADHVLCLENGNVRLSLPLSDALNRIDSPLKLDNEAGVILSVHVADIDPQWHLARLDFNGGSLWTNAQGLHAGQTLRIRILARDVSLAEQCYPSSIQNVLPCVVEAIADDEVPGQTLLRIRIGESVLLAKLTSRAVAALALTPGKSLWAQIKSVALTNR